MEKSLVVERVADPLLAPLLASFVFDFGGFEGNYEGADCFRSGRTTLATEEATLAFLAEEFRDSITKPLLHGVLIAKEDSEWSLSSLQGLLHFSIGEYAVDIHDLIVQPQYRKMGVASKLFKTLLESIVEPGRLRVLAEVNVDNVLVQEGLERLGFRQISISYVR